MYAADVGCIGWLIAVPLVVHCCRGCHAVCLSWSAPSSVSSGLFSDRRGLDWPYALTADSRVR